MKRILILEDDPLRMVQFRGRLKEWGGDYSLDHAETAAHAIRLLDAGRYDLILLDHDLGGRTYVDHGDPQEDCGMRVAEWLSIRPERVNQHGPVIVHSLNGPAAKEMVELISEAIWAPFLWTKPVWDKFLKMP